MVDENVEFKDIRFIQKPSLHYVLPSANLQGLNLIWFCERTLT